MLQFHEFPNILIHPGEFKSKNGSTEVVFSIEGYQTEVMILLSKLRWKWTGWAVMCEILRNNPRKMRVEPYLAGMQSLSPTDTRDQAIQKLKTNFNATAGPTDWAKATPKGQAALSCGGANQNQPFGVTGIGSGSDSVVKFTPAMWETSDVTAAFGATNAAGPGVKKDEILLHEMVHGMRQMTGTSLCAATPDNAGLDTVEEFMAIVISNVYRSELGFRDLRADHRGFAKLAADLTDSQKFLDKDKDQPTSNFKRMQQLKKEHPRLCENLAKVTATFNPFKLI
jgi:hypothetical protein